MTAQSQINTSAESNFTSPQIEASLINFLTALSSQHCSSATIRNYRSDIRQFYKFMEIEELEDLFTRQSLKDFVLAQHGKGLKDSSVTRKIASITQFALWCEAQGLIDQDISWMDQTSINSLLDTKISPNKAQETKKGLFNIFKNKNSNKIDQIAKQDDSAKITDTKLVSQFAAQVKPDSKKSFASTTNLILPYLNLGLMILFFIGLGFLGYNQLVKETPVSFAYPSTPTRADRVLSFQGRLTDTAQNPVTIPTPMEFKIWDQLTGGTEGSCDGTTDCKYQTGSCSVTPDQDGIFNVGIGDDCGIEIDDAVFTENSALWLEVIVDSETLTPRQPIRTVPFAVNSETVQGFPINSTQSATTNTILVMDAGGNVTLGENNPTLRSVSGTFTISGGTLSLEATSDILFSDARVTDLPLSLVDTQIDPALSQGIVDAINDVYNFSAGNAFWSELSNLLHPTQYWSDDLAVGGNSTSSAGIWLSNTGAAVFNEQGSNVDFRVESDTDVAALFIEGSNGFVGLGDATPDHRLDVAGNIGLDASGYINWGDVDGTSGYGLRDNSGTLQFKNSSGTWTDFGVAGNTYWEFFNGTLTPRYITADVNIGGTSTDSAKISLAGSLDRGKAAVIINQTENQPIFAASASGVPKFTIANNGNLTLANSEYISNSTDDFLVFGGGNGSINTDLSIDLDGNNPVLFSTAGLGIEINDRLYIGTNNRYFYDDTADLRFSDDLRADGSFAVGSLASTGNIGELLTSSNIIVGDQASLRLRESASNGTNYTGFRAPSLLSTDIIYTLPDTAGTTGTVLMNDGSGNLIWGSNTAGDFWQLTDGMLSPSYLGLGLNIGDTATTSARVSISGALDRGMSALIVNQTENQDIFTASASGTTRFTIDYDGNLDVTGDIGLAAGNYINWGTVLGSSGYGIRDNAGIMQFKNSGGSWLDFSSGGSGGYWQLNDGVLSPFSLTTDTNFGSTATNSAKVSIAGSLTRGMSALIVNQTENQDIFTASASGATKFTIDKDGNLNIVGNVAIGDILSSPNKILNIDKTLADSGGAYGAYSVLRLDSISTDPDYYFGGYISAQTAAGNNTDYTGGLRGLKAYGEHNGTGTIGSVYGGEFQVNNNSSGVISQGVGLKVLAPQNSGGGSITDYIGLELEAPAFGRSIVARGGEVIFNDYGNAEADFIVRGDTDFNLFNVDTSTDRVGIGDATPDHKLDVEGNIGIMAGGYLNWGDADGTGGYGFRDNGGTLQYKFSGGNWTDIGLASNAYWQLNNGTISPFSLGADVNIGSNATASAKVSLAGALDRGKAAVIINQTENQDIFTASSSGITRFAIDYGGNATLSGSLKLGGQLQLANFSGDPTAMGDGALYYNTTNDGVYYYNGTTWVSMTGGASYWQLNSGALSPTQTSYEINLGNIATNSAKISLAGSETRGKAAVIINQTENQDIFTASASGVTKFKIENDGDVYLTQLLGTTYNPYNNIDFMDSGIGVNSYLSFKIDLDDDNNDTTENFTIRTNGGANELFRVNSNGNTGIGDTTPEGKLDVEGAVTGQALVQINELGNQDIFTASRSGLTRMRIDNDGYVHSQRFVDLANSAYYLDPAATGTSLNAAGDGKLEGGQIYLYNTNTYVSGDGTDLTFKDSHLTSQIALSETGTTQLHAGFTTNSIIAALNELMNISLGDTTNIFLNSLRLQQENGLLYELFQDGVADEFEGLSGVDTNLSAYTYDSVNDWFSRANPTSDVVEDTRQEFLEGSFINATASATPVLELEKAVNTGTGADGDATISATKNVNSDIIAAGRNFADSVAYKVTGIASNAVSTDYAPHGIVAGDEVILINMQGDASNYANVGTYEFLTVNSVSGLNIAFTSTIQSTYGVGGNSNLSGQDVIIQRVPQYDDVTIQSGGTLTAGDWDNLETVPTTPTGTAGYQTGLLVFRATGTTTVSSGGSINMNGKGYRGGAGSSSNAVLSYRGESTGGVNDTQTATPTTQGGGGGTLICQGGGGGGYGAAGVSGIRSGSSCSNYANLGASYGNANLTQLHLGSGGGGGGGGYGGTWNILGGTGGDGGGAILIYSDQLINAAGSIVSNGTDGGAGGVGDTIPAGGGGGGAGGSIHLQAKTVNVSGTTTTAAGLGGVTNVGSYGSPYTELNGGRASGGNGAVGRIKITATNITGTTTPTATTASLSLYEDYGIFTSDEIQTPNTISFDLIEWSENLNTYGEVQVMTRSGNTANSTDGTWEAWKPVVTNINEKIIDNMDAQGNWTSYTPFSIVQDVQNEFGFNNETYRTVESGGLDGSVTIEKYIDNGDAHDGSITVSSSKNLNTDIVATGRSYADAVTYAVSSISSISLVTSATPNGIVAGDEVILINLQGDTNTTYANTGNYEFLKVSSVVGTTLNFENAISNIYGYGSNLDLTGQKVVVQRVPQYYNVTVQSGGVLTANDWNGTSGGLLVFRVAGTFEVQSGGSVNMNGKGYRGGAGSSSNAVISYRGESTGAPNDVQTVTPTTEGGGGGTPACQGGGGGGYGTNGVSGNRSGSSCSNYANLGSSYGDTNLTKLNLGSGGGGGGAGYGGTWNVLGGTGGDGGGIVYISANTITSSAGSIVNNGTDGGAGGVGDTIPAGGGGGGAGGAIYIGGNVVNVSGTITSSGGAGGVTNVGSYGSPYTELNGGRASGGNGAVGRVRIDANRVTGSTTPTYTNGTSLNNYHPFGVFTSSELQATSAAVLDMVSWTESLGNVGEIQVQTRTGNSTDATDGTWEAWKPVVNGTNEVTLDTMNTHTSWTGTNTTVAEGDTTRNIDNYEDEDEGTAGNLAKFSTSTEGGYAETDLGSGNTVNLSSYDYISFWVRSDVTSDKLTFSFGEASGDEQSETVTIDQVNVWQKIYWDISDIAAASRDNVRYLRVTNNDIPAVVYYLDNIKGGRYITSDAGYQIPSTVNNYIQYRVILSTTNVTAAPTLENITLNYRSSTAHTMVLEGDTTRNIDFFEDEDESTAGNITKVSFTAQNGYIQRDLGSGNEIDLSNYDYLSFWMKTSESGKKWTISMGESSYVELSQTLDAPANTWQKFYWDLTDISTSSRNAIRYLRLTQVDSGSTTVYLDDLTANRYESTPTNGAISSSVANYIQYRVILSTTDTTVTPTVSSVTINYTDQLGHTDNTQSAFDSGTTKFQSESTVGNTIQTSKNRPYVGLGEDGSITVSTSKNINTDVIAGGRAYADGVSYSISSLNTNAATTSAVPNGIKNGDEVMLINLQGDGTNYSNVGTYEFLTVESVNSTRIKFTSNIAGTYGVGGNSNLTGQKIVVQRVPHYNNVTISNGGTLTANDWNGTSGGLLVFRASGTVTVQGGGYINMNGKGYRGGAGYNVAGEPAFRAESTALLNDTRTPTSTTEGGGGGASAGCQGGGGGAYGSTGAIGLRSGSSCANGTNNSSAYGVSNLTKLHLGSGGGGGGVGYGGAWNILGGTGGDGGGIIYISANTITIEDGVSLDGTLSSNGTDGGAGGTGDTIPAGGGGGGAGGAIYLKADVANIPVNTTASAGSGGVTNVGSYGSPYTELNGGRANGGNGSVGRIKIDANSVTGTTTPTYVAGTNSGYYYPYSVFTSNEINTAGASTYDALTWLANLGTGGMVQFMTRSGSTADSTDGTWQEWRPLYATNEAILQTANTHGDWVGYTPLSKIDDTRAEFDATSVDKFRVSSNTTPSLSLDRYVDDGDGSDGPITLTGSKNINVETIAAGRVTYADGIAYKVTASTITGSTLTTADTPNGIVAGDEVLLINLQGATGDYADVGNYEFLEVASVAGSNITFKSAIVNSYDGTTPANQKVVIQRVPQYTTVTIQSGGYLTASGWDGLTTTPAGSSGYFTGIVAFRATGLVDVQLGGTITTQALGYRGGAGYNVAAQPAFRAESTADLNNTRTATPTSEGGGGGSAGYCQGGGGGAYGTAGAVGLRSGSSCANGANNPSAYGDANLSKINLGSGGGGGGVGYGGAWNILGGTGGNGGGIIFISANAVEVDTHPVSTHGKITADGNGGGAGGTGDTIPAGGGGGGAGGAIYIQANYTDLSGDVTASGGTGGVTNVGSYGSPYTELNGGRSSGGNGGTGRVRVDTNELTSGTATTPTYTAGITNRPLHRYGIYTSDELSTNSAADFKDIEWFENINTSYSDIQVQTRTGNTADSTTGTWEAWRPITGGVNTVSIENMNTHTNWTGTNVTVADGDVTRNNNFYEDEDESTAGNVTKFSSSTAGGYAARDLGAGNEVNLSNYNYVSFWIRADKDNTTFKLGMGEAAATEQEETIIIDAADTWQKVYWDLSDMTTAARDSIRYLRLTYLDDSTGTVNFYLDNITGAEFLTEPTGSDITSSAGNYVQYRLIFSTTDTTSSLTAPAVYSVKLNYVTPSAVFYSQEGDVTRNVDGYEDEDESTATNITRVVASSTDSDGNFVEAVIPSTDLTNYDYLAFWVRTSASATEIPMRIGFGELESDEQQMDFVVETPFQWQKVFFDISDVPAASKNAVTKLRVTNLAPHTNDIYIDDFTANRYMTTSGYQPNTTANNYVQYRAILTSTDTSSFPSISQVSIAYSGESNVVSEEFEANVLPRRANLISWADLGTGSIDYWASRDNGVTWTPVTMTQQATESGDMKIFSGFADLTSQPEGTTMRWKARINGNAVLASMAMRWESGGGADLAEWYPTTDKSISAAEVVSADTTSTQSAYIARTTKAYDPAVIGVISTAPGLQIGEKAENTKRVALAGRVPVKVASDSAAILPGDFITSSNVPGRAMKAMKTGYTIGKALEAWTPGSGKDWVMMFVNLGTYLDGKDIGGVDNASLEEIFGEETSHAVNIVNASNSGENTNNNPESTPSGEINEATGSGEVATGSGQLNPNTATPSATLVKESLSSRLKKLADERLDAFLGWTKTEATISGEVLEGTTTNSNFDSITKYQSDLFEAKNKFITYGETVKNTVGATTINAYGSLNAAGATIYGKLVAGSVEVYGKFTAVSGQFLDLFSNIIRTNNLQTSMISPIADDGSIHVRLGENKDASSSAKPALVIENSAGSSVTSIDKDGNIITLGTIISRENKTSTVTAEVIYAKDASISGNLDASSARIQELEARIAQVEQIKSDTAEIVNATISGTLFAENIDSFSEKVAAAIEEPSLLAKLTGSTNQNSVESVESYFASRSAFLADIDTSSPSRLALSDLTLDEDALVIDADAIYVDQYLDVNGSAFVAEKLGIGQSLVLSDSMFITAGSIDFAPTGVDKPVLALQPSGKGVLSLMGNLFTLDDTGLAQLTGNLEVSGDVKVGGTLLANLMKLNDYNNPFQVQLATKSGDVLGETVQESRFEIVNELGVPVATISAQGKAEFASGLGIGSEELQVASDSGTIESEKTSGTATIKANSNEIVIKSKIVTGKSLIYLTPLGSTNNQVLYVKEIATDNPETPEVESSFKVGFDYPVNNDLRFNWWIVN